MGTRRQVVRVDRRHPPKQVLQSFLRGLFACRHQGGRRAFSGLSVAVRSKNLLAVSNDGRFDGNPGTGGENQSMENDLRLTGRRKICGEQCGNTLQRSRLLESRDFPF